MQEEQFGKAMESALCRPIAFSKSWADTSTGLPYSSVGEGRVEWGVGWAMKACGYFLYCPFLSENELVGSVKRR